MQFAAARTPACGSAIRRREACTARLLAAIAAIDVLLCSQKVMINV